MVCACVGTRVLPARPLVSHGAGNPARLEAFGRRTFRFAELWPGVCRAKGPPATPARPRGWEWMCRPVLDQGVA